MYGTERVCPRISAPQLEFNSTYTYMCVGEYIRQYDFDEVFIIICHIQDSYFQLDVFGTGML